MSDKEQTSQKKGYFFWRIKKLRSIIFEKTRSYGSVKEQTALRQSTVLSGNKAFLSMYRSIRLKFQVFVKGINENWSLDLAHVDKLSKYNRNVEYLLVAVDSLSRYLRWNQRKQNMHLKQLNPSKKRSKRNNQKKCGLTMVKNFLERLNSVTKAVFICIAHSVKNSAFAQRNARSLKKIIHRYLQEEWKYPYIDQLDISVDTINSRVIRVIKFAPRK